MKIYTVSLMPWRATNSATHWCACGVMLLTLLLGITTYYSEKHFPLWNVVVAGIMAPCAFFIAAFFLGPTMLLAIDARRLNIPGIQREALLSVMLYGGISVALPTALLGGLIGQADVIIAMFALAISAGLVIGWLPRSLAIALVILPEVWGALPIAIAVPRPMESGFFSFIR